MRELLSRQVFFMQMFDNIAKQEFNTFKNTVQEGVGQSNRIRDQLNTERLQILHDIPNFRQILASDLRGIQRRAIAGKVPIICGGLREEKTIGLPLFFIIH